MDEILEYASGEAKVQSRYTWRNRGRSSDDPGYPAPHLAFATVGETGNETIARIVCRGLVDNVDR